MIGPKIKVFKLGDMKNGWFIGDFLPSLFKSSHFEVAVKEYPKGSFEPKHFHKIATEITVIAVGLVRMNGKEYTKGDIIVIEPGISTDFEALENSITTVVKIPSASNDKYIND